MTIPTNLIHLGFKNIRKPIPVKTSFNIIPVHLNIEQDEV